MGQTRFFACAEKETILPQLFVDIIQKCQTLVQKYMQNLQDLFISFTNLEF